MLKAVTVRELVEDLTKMMEQNGEIADFPLVFSSDEEGNSFQKITNFPGLAKARSLNERYLEMLPFEEEQEPNCIIIN